jgi:hypothetical protein
MKVYNYDNRKIIVCRLYRHLLKSSFRLKDYDEHVFEYTKLLIRSDFDKYKKQKNTLVIKNRLKYGEAVLSDMLNLNAKSFNYIVTNY